MKVIAKNNWMELKKGQTFTVVDEFFYNGECWYKLKDKLGVVFEYPTVFFVTSIFIKTK